MKTVGYIILVIASGVLIAHFIGWLVIHALVTEFLSLNLMTFPT